MTGRLLLDTHALLWMLLEPHRIPDAVLDRLRDPFDRMIAAQSMIESPPVVTADHELAAFPGINTIW